jgi:hypothetical protein
MPKALTVEHARIERSCTPRPLALFEILEMTPYVDGRKATQGSTGYNADFIPNKMLRIARVVAKAWR